jgi:multidrug resistance efflux pump
MPRLCCALIPLTVVLALTGCQSNEAFQASLHSATTDISHGRLDSARLTLDQADSLASGAVEHQKVADLNAVINGAEAMIDGQPEAAASAWSSVEDKRLRLQIQHEAEVMGINLQSNNQEDTR